MIDLSLLVPIGTMGTAAATIILVIVIWKTVRHLEEAAKLSKLESNYRFRPWVGPSSGIEQISSTDGSNQYSIALRNFGELPAFNVAVSFAIKNGEITRSELKSASSDFNLGPLLPTMEKHYWFFMDSDMMQKAKNDNSKISILLYFSYTYEGEKADTV